MIRIFSAVGQKLTPQMKKTIRDAFEEEYRTWEEEGQENLRGEYTLTVCENVEVTENMDDYISVPIDKDGADGGYLHVYGLAVKA